MPQRTTPQPFFSIHTTAADQARAALQTLAKETGWVRAMQLGPGQGPANSPFLIRLAVEPNGRLICTGLILGLGGKDEVTARSLRQIPIAPLLAVLADMKPSKRPLGLEGLYRDLPAYSPQRPGPRGHSRAHFEKVAAAYRAASLSGSPVRAIAEDWHVSEPTVRRWVQRARDMGILGPPRPGKAGELTPKRRGTK